MWELPLHESILLIQDRKHRHVHVEDDPGFARSFETVLKSYNFTYHNVPTKKDLENLLEVSRADNYLVDGNFPDQQGGEVRYNLPEAVEMIRSKDPGAEIVLCSANRDLSKIALEYNLPYFNKINAIEAIDYFCSLNRK